MGRLVGVLLALVPVAPLAASAQPVVPVEGEEVRVVQRAQRGAVRGLYVEATEQSIVLRTTRGSEPILIPRADVTGMSVQRGFRSHGLRGALLGAGVGVVAGVIVGQTSEAFDGTGQAVGVSVAAALPIGLVIGLLVRSPEWEGIDLGALRPRP